MCVKGKGGNWVFVWSFFERLQPGATSEMQFLLYNEFNGEKGRAVHFFLFTNYISGIYISIRFFLGVTHVFSIAKQPFGTWL